MFSKLIPLLISLIIWCTLDVEGQVYKKDSTQRAGFLNGLILKQKYKKTLQESDLNETDIGMLYAKGYEFYEAEQYEDAFKLFGSANSQMVKLDSNRANRTLLFNTYPLFMMAICKKALDQADSAIFLLKRVLSYDPISSISLNELSILYVIRKQYDSALYYNQEAIRINARDVVALYNKAYIHFIRNQPDKARESLKKLLMVDTKHENGLLLMAYVLEYKGDKKALSYLNEFVGWYTNSSVGYRARGTYYMRRSQYDLAIQDFTKLLLLDSNNVEALGLISDARIRGGEIEEGTAAILKFWNAADTASADFKVNIIQSESFELLTQLHNEMKDKAEKDAGLKMFVLLYQDAAKHIREIEDIAYQYPSSLVCQRMHFLALYTANQHEKFKYQLHRLYTLEPNLPNTMIMESTLSYAAMTLPKRIERMKQAIQLKPERPYYHYLYGLFELENGNEKEGKNALFYSIKLDPSFARSYIMLGELNRIKGKYDSAVYYFQKGMRYTRFVTECQYGIAITFLNMRKPDSVLKYLNAALNANPEAYRCYLTRSEVHFRLKLYKKAHADLDSFFRYEDHPDAFAHRIKIYLKQADYKRAFAAIHARQKQYPNNTFHDILLGDVYFEQKNYNEALAKYKQILKSRPYFISVLEKAGLVCYAMGDTAGGNKFFYRAIEKTNTGFTEDYMEVAAIFNKMGRNDKAIQFYEYALKGDSSNVMALGKIGWAHYQLGNYAQCISYSKRVLWHDSTAMFAAFNIALSELRMGNFQRARYHYQLFMEQNTQRGLEFPEEAAKDLHDLLERNILVEESKSLLREIFNEKL